MKSMPCEGSRHGMCQPKLEICDCTCHQVKPILKIVGQDGNAFNLLGLAQRAAVKAGWSIEKWNSVRDEAVTGDYDHLLATLMNHFDVQ